MSSSKHAAPSGRPENWPLPVPELLLHYHGSTLFSAFRQWAAQEHVPPVLLLTGPAGIGKREIAFTIAQWILCEKSPFGKPAADENSANFDLFGGTSAESAENHRTEQPTEHQADHQAEQNTAGILTRPCGECASCRRALHGNWVDFREIASEDEDGGTLKIDQFRDLRAQAGFGAHEGSYRIFLITHAERMTPQAANSMLKLLEEPPRGWMFLLTAADASLLLPTLVSRCQRLRLKPLPEATVRQLLLDSGVRGDRATVCARLAHGSLAKARALAEEETWEQRKNLFRFLDGPSEHLSGWVDWAAADNAHFNLLLDQLEQALEDLLRFTLWPQVGATNADAFDWSNTDGAKSLADHARRASQALGSLEGAREFWLGRAERLARVRQESQAPLNRKILLQDLLTPWLEIR